MTRPEDHRNPVCAWVMHRIREIRLSKRMTVNEVAYKAGVPLGSYSCLETGRYRPNLEVLFRLLSVLGIQITEVWPESSGATNGTVTDQAVRDAIRRAAEGQAKPVQYSDVLAVVCSLCNATEEELSGPSRLRHLSDARTIATVLVKEEPHLRLVGLAYALNRDVSSLSHTLRRLPQRLRFESAFKRQVQEAKAALKKLKQGRQDDESRS